MFDLIFIFSIGLNIFLIGSIIYFKKNNDIEKKNNDIENKILNKKNTRKTRRFIHSIITLFFLIFSFAYYLRYYNNCKNFIQIEYFKNSDILKYIYLSFLNTFDKDIVTDDCTNLLLLTESIIIYSIFISIIISSTINLKTTDKPEIETDYCYYNIWNYKKICAAYKNSFLTNIFIFLINLIECFNIGSILRMLFLNSKNNAIDLWIFIKFILIFLCLIYNFEISNFIVSYLVFTTVFTYIYHDIFCELKS